MIDNISHDDIYNYKSLEFKNTSYFDIVELIINQNVVGIFQGKSEAGPRALGNRSLLFDPRNPSAKDILNDVKCRKSYNPVAATILLEYFQEWFKTEGLKESPFMSYAIDIVKEKKQYVSGIMHVDETCRVQTITKKQNYHYYNLINSFYMKTKIPILCNTSFNLSGEVLVYRQKDAIDMLCNSSLKYLYFPEKEKLLIKKD